jgi:NADH-quinone oxidoreductase subunit N
MEMNYGDLIPEIAVLAAAVLVLMTGSFLPRAKQSRVLFIAYAGLAVAIVVGVVQAATPTGSAFSGTFALDSGTAFIRIVAPVATGAVLALGANEIRGRPRESETVALLLLATLGALVLGAAHDLLILATGFLLSSVPLYGLIGIGRSARAVEAAMKTYLQGALFGVVMLGGIAVLFGVGGATEYGQLAHGLTTAPPVAVAIGVIAVLIGLLFEAGAAPAHFWVPDAAQASERLVAAFLTTVPKLAALIALIRLTLVVQPEVDLALIVAVVAAATMTIGNLAALAQTDVRRLLGWSTVAQVGYLLMPIAGIAAGTGAAAALLLALAGYAVTNLTAFAVVAAQPARTTIDDWRGTARTHPVLVGALLIALLSLVGTPPTAVFIGKLAVFSAAWSGGYGWLVLIAAANTVVSLAYYLRWLAACFRQPAEVRERDALVSSPAVTAIGLAIAVLLFAAVPILGPVVHLL